MADKVVVARDFYYRVIPHKVSIRDKDTINNDLSKEELFATLSFMWNGKSPRLDIFPCEFYKGMWETVGDDFCHLASKAFSSGTLTKFINQGLIKLIPKKCS